MLEPAIHLGSALGRDGWPKNRAQALLLHEPHSALLLDMKGRFYSRSDCVGHAQEPDVVGVAAVDGTEIAFSFPEEAFAIYE